MVIVEVVDKNTFEPDATYTMSVRVGFADSWNDPTATTSENVQVGYLEVVDSDPKQHCRIKDMKHAADRLYLFSYMFRDFSDNSPRLHISQQKRHRFA